MYYNVINDNMKVIELDPKNEVAYRYLGLAKQELNDFYNSIYDLSKAIQINPSDTKSYGAICLAKFMQENYLFALEDCSKAINLDPTGGKDGYLYNYRANIYLKLSKKNNACEDFKKAIRYGFKYNKNLKITNRIYNYKNCKI